jgi:conjugal transfer pilus assembly protein TraB
MIIENNKEKIKKNFKLILSILAIVIACAFLLFFNQPQKNESDIAKIINNRNKIILHNPNTNLKAEDRWLESAENKLEVYEEFQKNYGNDKSKIESQINQIDEKYNQIISKQNELIQGQSNQIEELKNQFKTKPNNNSKDPFGANNEAVVANKTIQNFHLNLSDDNNQDEDKDGEFFKGDEYVPAGAYATATIISGVDASVGISSQSDPRPILLRITSPAYSSIYDNVQQKVEISGCLITGAASGDLSSEKVYIKLINMTCSKDENLVYETAIKGYVAGQGKSGVRGQVISREGDFLAKSFLAGLVGGFGQGLSSRVAPPLSFSSGATLLNGYSNEDVVKKGVGQGIGSASDRLSNYLINRAEQYQPIVSIPSGIEVEVVFVEGFNLNGKRHRKPSAISNKFISRFEDKN